MRFNTQVNVESLLAAQTPGYALSQALYRDRDIFDLDIERIFKRRWLLVDHTSRIPHRGDFFTFEIAGESIIIVRGENDHVAAFYNVCRHRGSRICLEHSGHSTRLICPYHSWTYGLDGRLITARKMPQNFDKRNFSLRRCAAEVVEGLIFINIGETPPEQFIPVCAAIAPFLQLHDLAGAKVAARESFQVAANWKLVVENFLECYHCLATHPEYCAVNSIVKLLGDGTDQATAQYLEEWERWKKTLPPAHLAQAAVSSAPQFDTRNPFSITQPEGEISSSPVFSALRAPIGNNYLSMSEDGKPVAPLMGRFDRYDGGKTSVSVDYVGRVSAANDYAALFKFVPISPELTHFEIIWLVREDAEASKDYDIGRLKWLWHITTTQDKTLAENNQRGVNSRAYVPGPYSELEDAPKQFVRWYLDQLSDPGPDTHGLQATSSTSHGSPL